MTTKFSDLVPAHIREIDAYRPGKPVEEVERELGIHAVKLASNENPLGPSPKAVEAIRKFVVEGNRYPDGGGFYLRQKLAAHHGVAVESVILGLGSSELIDLAARALLGSGLEGLTSKGTFPLYRISIRGSGATLTEVPLREYAFDLDALASAITSRTRVVYIANPNNPTGTLFLADEFARFLDRVPPDVLVVLDEAYFDYVDHPGYSRSVEEFLRRGNLFVLRTFSKIHGLAGIRIGYGIGPADLLEELNKLRTPFNTAGVAQAAALAALDDPDHVQQSRESNRGELAWLSGKLFEAGAQIVPSSTNFVFVILESSGDIVADQLLKRGVIVRPMGWMGFPEAIRVSVGTRKENEKFMEAFAQVRAQAGSARR